MRFLFTTTNPAASEFYGRVGAALARRGHEAAHVTTSREGAAQLREQGHEGVAMPDALAQIGEPDDLAAEVVRIEHEYELPTIRELYRRDPESEGSSDDAAVRRSVRYVRALERIFDELRP